MRSVRENVSDKTVLTYFGRVSDSTPLTLIWHSNPICRISAGSYVADLVAEVVDEIRFVNIKGCVAFGRALRHTWALPVTSMIEGAQVFLESGTCGSKERSQLRRVRYKNAGPGANSRTHDLGRVIEGLYE